jgi:aflatoxin B1 aldehyde reductase
LQSWYGSNILPIPGRSLIFHISGVDQTRVHRLEDTAPIPDTFQKHGLYEIDTARYYGQGSSEEYHGQPGWQKRGLVMDMKCYPTVGRNMPGDQWSHQPQHLRENLMRPLKALQAEKIHM